MDLDRRVHPQSRQQHYSFGNSLRSAVSHLENAAPSPPYTTPGSNYSPNAQRGASPVRGLETPEDLFVANSQIWAPDPGVTLPPVLNMGTVNMGNDNGKGGGSKHALPASPVAGKSKRVRTGCLTCRERHLKCDEGVPHCNNCRKSNRECRRGIRLNFLDIQVKDPPRLASTAEWSVQILDESRSIASEYKGGLDRYPKIVPSSSEADLDVTCTRQTEPADSKVASSSGEASTVYRPNDVGQPPPREVAHKDSDLARANAANLSLAPRSAPRLQPGVTGFGQDILVYGPLDENDMAKGPNPDTRNTGTRDELSTASPVILRDAGSSTHALQPSSQLDLKQALGAPTRLMTPSSEQTTGERDYLNADEEIVFMQVFIDEVAVWMDALDKDKHFATTVPYIALKLPMLLNAMLACGAKHLALIGAQDGVKADYYYGIAMTQLLRSQQGRDRDLTECALTAVILNAYEIMGERPSQRLGRVATTRALIRECGWDASSAGLGAACFWVNVGMEVLSCISFGWPTAWEPDQWGLDLEFAILGAASRSRSRSVAASDDIWGVQVDNQSASHPGVDNNPEQLGGEELWVHRIFYILAKVANFRANTPQFQEPSPHDEQVRLQNRFAEWRRLQNMCNAWNLNCPRSMRPYGYSPGPSPKSLFPNVWLIKPSAKLGRTFYHTAMCLLAQTNPLDPRDSRENRASQLHHAHHVCGIVAHTRDRGVISIAIRSLAVAGAALDDRREQSEVLGILQRISSETGWRLGRIAAELKSAWGWEDAGTSPPSASNLGRLAPLPTAGLPQGINMRSGRGGEGREKILNDWG